MKKLRILLLVAGAVYYLANTKWGRTALSIAKQDFLQGVMIGARNKLPYTILLSIDDSPAGAIAGYGAEFFEAGPASPEMIRRYLAYVREHDTPAISQQEASTPTHLTFGFFTHSVSTPIDYMGLPKTLTATLQAHWPL